VKHSIVIPAHNEAPTLEAFVSDFVRSMLARQPGIDWEVLVVENGSVDATLDAARRVADGFPDVVRVLASERRSYGGALKHGILNCSGQSLTVLECDALSVPFVEHSVRLLSEGSSRFIVGSKRHPQARDRRPASRRFLTWFFNALLRVFLGYPGSDTHGLKSLDTALARRLCELSIAGDEMVQTELVLVAWALGEQIAELPVDLSETRPTPVSIGRRLPHVMRFIPDLRRSVRRFSPPPEGLKRPAIVRV
jgi:hypothetical protein